MDRPKLGIIIPAYNEEKTIGHIVSAASQSGVVIVVNDCSSDNTAAVALANGAVVVDHKINKGYEGALNSGFQKASDLNLDYVITIDADGQHDVNTVNTFFKAIQEGGYSCVVGVRPKAARISEKAMGIYFDLKYKVRDPLCGLKCYNMDVWKENSSAFSHFNSIGTSLLHLCCVKNYRIQQIPISIRNRADQPRFGNVLKANWKIFKALGHIIQSDLANAANVKK